MKVVILAGGMQSTLNDEREGIPKIGRASCRERV